MLHNRQSGEPGISTVILRNYWAAERSKKMRGEEWMERNKLSWEAWAQSFVIPLWVRLVSSKKPAENNYLKKMKLLIFLLYKFLRWFNPAPHPFCECCVQSNEAPFILLWSAVRNLSYWEGLFQPQRLLRDLGAEKYRVQGSSES